MQRVHTPPGSSRNQLQGGKEDRLTGNRPPGLHQRCHALVGNRSTALSRGRRGRWVRMPRNCQRHPSSGSSLPEHPPAATTAVALQAHASRQAVQIRLLWHLSRFMCFGYRILLQNAVNCAQHSRAIISDCSKCLPLLKGFCILRRIQLTRPSQSRWMITDCRSNPP